MVEQCLVSIADLNPGDFVLFEYQGRGRWGWVYEIYPDMDILLQDWSLYGGYVGGDCRRFKSDMVFDLERLTWNEPIVAEPRRGIVSRLRRWFRRE